MRRDLCPSLVGILVQELKHLLRLTKSLRIDIIQRNVCVVQRWTELEPADQLEVALFVSGGHLLVVGLLGIPRDQSVRLEGLELYRIGARIGSSVDQRACHAGIAVMVYPGLCDDEHLPVCALGRVHVASLSMV